MAKAGEYAFPGFQFCISSTDMVEPICLSTFNRARHSLVQFALPLSYDAMWRRRGDSNPQQLQILQADLDRDLIATDKFELDNLRLM